MNSFSNIATIGNEKTPDIIYYNGSIVSSRQVDNGFNSDPPLRFMETRTSNIIDDISKYEFSITRFNMDCGGDLPLFIPILKPNTITDTIYSFTVTYGTGASMKTSQKYIQYVSESVNAALPIATAIQDFGNRYYFVYTYQHWVDLCNATFLSIWTDLQTQAGVTFTTKAPVMTYDGSTNLFSIYFDSNGFGKASGAAGEVFNLYMNANAYQLFRNFNNKYYGTDSTNGMNNLIIVQNMIGNNLKTVSGVNYLVITQDFPSTSSIWSPISSITFCSSLLPVNAEQMGTPVIYTSSNYVPSQTSQSLYQPIITDICLPLDRSSDYKNSISYSPNSEYRMASLMGNGGINSLDISVFWRCKYNQQLYPITMPNGSTCSIKIMFRRKK